MRFYLVLEQYHIMETLIQMTQVHHNRLRPKASWFSVCLICFLLFSSLQAFGQTLIVSPQNDELSERLEAEALSLSVEDDEPPSDVIAAARGDYARLLAVTYEAGFFGAEISIRLAGHEAAEIDVFDTIRSVRPVDIRINLGAPFRFGRTEVSPLAPQTNLPEKFAPGAIASTEAIRSAGASALEAWREASHAKARVSSQDIVARHRQNRLDVQLRIDPGPALRFGALNVPDDSSVRAKRLRAISDLPSGAPYHPADLERVRRRLFETGAFDSVVVRERDTPNEDGTLDVDVEVTDADPRRVGFGIKIEQQAGFSFEAFWLKRNTFGGAERLRFDADIDGVGDDTGGIDVHVGASLSIPGFRRADDTLTLFANLERLDEVAFESDLVEFGVRRDRKLQDGALVVGLGGLFRFAETKDSFGTRRFQHLVLTWDAVLDRRDDKLDSISGRYFEVSAEPFVGLADDSGTGIRLTGDARAYRALGSQTVLAGRVQLGSVVGSARDETPPEFLFFSGGGGTVRGQSFQSLSIETPTGLIGGRGFLGASLELRQKISDTLGVVGFFDVGYISDESFFADGESHAGVGIGVRYFTSLGPIRADIGFPLGGDSEDSFGLFVGIGQAF